MLLYEIWRGGGVVKIRMGSDERSRIKFGNKESSGPLDFVQKIVSLISLNERPLDAGGWRI